MWALADQNTFMWSVFDLVDSFQNMKYWKIKCKMFVNAKQKNQNVYKSWLIPAIKSPVKYFCNDDCCWYFILFEFWGWN